MTARPWYATTGFVASAVFLVLVVAAGVALAVSSGGPDGDVRARARVNAATGGSVCGLPAGSQDPVVGPPVASWTLVGTIAAPTVRDVGPNLRLQIVGFRVAAVGRDDVNVTLALRSNLNGGAMVWWTLPMHWMTGDWRARLGSIDEPFIGGPLNGLDGYVRWSGA
jgi:hypothetical protein